MTKQHPFSHYVSLDTLNALIIDATVDKCASFTNSRILNAIKQRWTSVLRQRMEAINRGAHLTHQDSSTVPYNTVEQDLSPHVELPTQPVQESDEDDEFDDAEIESAQPLERLDSAAVVTEAAKSNKIEHTHSESASCRQQYTADHKDSDDDISVSDISDLDDKEAETKDLVIGMLDKITRPSSKKANAPMWKIKLKYGILQVNGIEIPFEKLEGDFEF